MLTTKKKIHFVGIGGAGMSAIAKVLIEKGYDVSGSDLKRSEVTERLAKMGADIKIGQKAENIEGKEVLVVSTAIQATNPELVAAKEQNIPVLHRSDVVAFLMNESSRGIAVAGAHGKTTTTSMSAVVLERCGLDPTVIIGGDVDYLGGNAKLGHSGVMVAEADESDGSFLTLYPKVAIVTNIENDHMDHYGTMENILTAFRQFLHNLPEEDGVAILCFDNEHIRNMAPQIERTQITYAIEHDADYQAKNIVTIGQNTSFDVYYQEELCGQIVLNVPGKHNVLNALATVAAAREMGVEMEAIAEAFTLFNGAKRRFQTKAKADGVWIVDDYAHHPTEINTTLTAARQTKPKRLVCVFQPHRYTRTYHLATEFGAAFDEADVLILTDIYSAGEAPIDGVDGELIVCKVKEHNGKDAVYIKDWQKIADYLETHKEEGDLIMTMGAGNIYEVGEDLAERLASKA